VNQQTPTLLMTRPQLQGERFLAQVQSQVDVPAVISPILDIVLEDVSLQVDHSDTLIFSSENAVRAYAHSGLSGSAKAFCVGKRTARAAAELGLEAVSADGNVEMLEASIKEAKPTGRMIYLAGKHVRGSLDLNLVMEGFDVKKVVCYNQAAQQLSAEAKDVLTQTGRVIVPIFSPRSADLLSDALGQTAAALDLIFMSEAVDKAWRGAPGAFEETVPEPTGAAMLDAICARVAAATAA
jgi:uroporphyrinogen-III synthase